MWNRNDKRNDRGAEKQDPRPVPEHLRTAPRRSWRTVEALGPPERTGGFNGGFNGGVFVVEDKHTGKQYIEKRAKKEHIDKGFVEAEISFLNLVSDHPHISKMVDYFVDKSAGRASIYMELCTEGGLDKIVEEYWRDGQKFDEATVWEWFIQLADALMYCHYGKNPEKREANGWKSTWNRIWHRDIKLANILITKGTRPGHTGEYIAKLADFGCAVDQHKIYANQRNNRDESSFKTRHWEPPEAPGYVQGSDIWQLGGVIACLCSLEQLADHIDTSHPAPGYSADLNKAIKACMQRDPKERPRSEELFKWINAWYNKNKDRLPEQPPSTPSNQQRSEPPFPKQPAAPPMPPRANSLPPHFGNAFQGRLDFARGGSGSSVDQPRRIPRPGEGGFGGPFGPRGFGVVYGPRGKPRIPHAAYNDTDYAMGFDDGYSVYGPPNPWNGPPGGFGRY